MMSRRRILIGGLAALLLGAVPALPVNAESLRIAPLQYRTTLKSGEKQKGYVDISNPEGDTVEVKFEVQAFRQIDNAGGIEFYTDEALSKGVLLDLDSAELGPHEVLRLVFLIDGTMLPHGEVYAAILARTVPQSTAGSAQSVRVGTVLEITNGSAGSHKASITDISAPFLQVGEGVSMTFVVHNEDSTGQTSGFRPKLKVGVLPYSEKETEGPLIFAGRSRTVTYTTPGNYFGFVRLSVKTGSSSKGQLAFVMTGYWRWLGPLMIAAIGGLVAMALYTRHKKH